MAKYIFVTGGVVSSLGKGITAASLGYLLKNRGLKVSVLKIDPYLNVDAGTMSPYQHGEVFVTDDGAETDLDLGHYERFIDINLSKEANVTSGKIYQSVIEKERKGDYLGRTVQMIPHLTNEIKNRIYKVGKNADVTIVEIGGTVGDIESLPFLEAIRQVRKEVGKINSLYIHTSYLPYLSAAGELKTKPTQHSVKEVRSIGIQPDIIVVRTEHDMTADLREKISLFCDVEVSAVIQNKNASSIYEVPLMLKAEGLDEKVIEKLGLYCPDGDIAKWRSMVKKVVAPKKNVKIAVIGKYVGLQDAYISVGEALKHGGIANDCRVDIDWINSELFEKEGTRIETLTNYDGVLIPGGFDGRGVEGKIKVVEFARKNKIPLLGLCLGLQCIVIEYARNMCGLSEAHSTEFDPDTPYPVVDFLPEQLAIVNKGGTMRKGEWPCKLVKDTFAYNAYKEENIYERHRHRFEVNNIYRKQLVDNGLIISGTLPDESLVEIVELKDHPFFVGVQFHPEFKSRPMRPHPLFSSFIKAAIK